MSGQPGKLLLVEGKADEHFAKAVLNDLGWPKTEVSVTEKGGYPQLRHDLPANFKVSALEAATARVGIIVDADDRPADRWKSLKARLEEIGYTGVPAAPVLGGLVTTTESLPALGIWMMPDNRSEGKVEHLFAAAIPSNNDLHRRAKATLDAIPESKERFAEKDRIKAEVYTWIAWGDRPDMPLGQAATHHHLVQAEACRGFRGWLDRLFGPVEAPR